ncbi:sensor histidine kinase [Ferrimonas pelagia]|uniref:histidine kinase n=1 Tax=Ferrimonas pelagia TaxID=1177826 RepID=A0ABP9F1G9_9GAMM
MTWKTGCRYPFKWLSCFLLLLFSAIGHAQSPIQPLIIGVLNDWGDQQTRARWQGLLEYLNTQLPANHFAIEPLAHDALADALKQRSIQLVITDPGHYLLLANRYPLSQLATSRSLRHWGSAYASGSAIWVRADSDYYNIFDLKQISIIANHPADLEGYQAVAGELLRHGLDPKRYLKRVKFRDLSHHALLAQVQQQQSDAAIVPFCAKERLVEQGLYDNGDFRLINAMPLDSGECQSSTALYPGLTISSTDEVSDHLATTITRALHNLPPEHPAAEQAEILGWVAPISLLSVQSLYQQQHLLPSNQGRLNRLTLWLQRNQHWAWLSLIALFSAAIYHCWIEYRYHQKSTHLIGTERRLRTAALQLQRLENSAILGEIGAGLAHEVNQPIAAISAYSEGGLHRLPADCPAEYAEVLSKIQLQADKAGAIVHRIRRLLKQQDAAIQSLTLAPLIDDCLLLLDMEFKQQAFQPNVEYHGTPSCLQGDPVGLQQVILNLLKNSLDALKQNPPERPPELLIRVQFSADQIALTIEDNGPGLSQPVHSLLSPFYSTKPKGLGLGLAICVDVAEAHGGQFTLSNRPEHGCQAVLILPLRGHP